MKIFEIIVIYAIMNKEKIKRKTYDYVRIFLVLRYVFSYNKVLNIIQMGK